MLLPYFTALIILVILINCYFNIAVRFNIIDEPNKRSSHSIPTIRGGGIVFFLSLVLFFLWNNFTYPYLFLAVALSATISFIDDIMVVNNRIKFTIQVIALVLLLSQCNILFYLLAWQVITIAIIGIGIINACNFMDGINGMTGLYALVFIGTLYLTEHNEQLKSLQLFLIISLLVFNFYNTRKKAKCFAGDVGSISLAIIMLFLLLMRIQQTGNYTCTGLLLLYGMDTIYTILQRLYQKENIFKPHRKHLYQYYCNEKKYPHVTVSTVYALIQLGVSLAIVYDYIHYTGLSVIFLLLSFVYWYLKAPLIRVSNSSVNAVEKK